MPSDSGVAFKRAAKAQHKELQYVTASLLCMLLSARGTRGSRATTAITAAAAAATDAILHHGLS
eukprot:17095-Heterococcus_DN1.PRE.1